MQEEILKKKSRQLKSKNLEVIGKVSQMLLRFSHTGFTNQIRQLVSQLERGWDSHSTLTSLKQKV